MNKPDELFPFPPFPLEKKEGPPTPLNPDEIRDLRTILELFRSGKLTSPPVTAPQEKADVDPFAELPTNMSQPIPTTLPRSEEFVMRSAFMKFLDIRTSSSPLEDEIRNSLKAICQNLEDQHTFVQAFCAIVGIFPICDFLRHSTPEQKMFSLNSLGDRFFQVISGMRFPLRKELVKIIGKYLSDSSTNYSFLSMEGEPFNNQFHERVDGSSSSGRSIVEMRGFVVTRINSDQIVRLGRVLT
ncbi:MAG: hypothetical protein HQM08_21155 [Candidatus Riflebacteria bacterium]|nr:hypothetical protein [Candidatus Riflebacteria bacterium]